MARKVSLDMTLLCRSGSGRVTIARGYATTPLESMSIIPAKWSAVLPVLRMTRSARTGLLGKSKMSSEETGDHAIGF